MTVAILCGGLGSRLGSETLQIPKSLVEVAGKPFIAHQLELLSEHGLTDIVLLTGHRGKQIRAVVGDAVRYSDDGDVSLGTAGAIRKALPLLGSRFGVLYGDSWLDCDYQAINQKRPVALTTLCRTDPHRNVYTDAGYSVFLADVFQSKQSQTWHDLTECFHSLSGRGALDAYIVEKPFMEIGSPAGLAAMRAHYADLSRHSR